MKVHRWMFLPIFLLAFLSVSAQAESQETDLPEHVWKEVVPRILKDSFKPAKSPMTIELYEEGLRWEWMPSIENVSFVLLTRKEIELRQINVHFFKTKARRSKKGEISIDFGFGDVFCSAGGSTWTYRESNGPLSLKKYSGGWGMGCSHGTAH